MLFNGLTMNVIPKHMNFSCLRAKGGNMAHYTVQKLNQRSNKPYYKLAPITFHTLVLSKKRTLFDLIRCSGNIINYLKTFGGALWNVLNIPFLSINFCDINIWISFYSFFSNELFPNSKHEFVIKLSPIQ